MIDMVFCPSRLNTPNHDLIRDYARFRTLGSVVLWTGMADALRRNVALRDDRINNWRTLHKLDQGDDENAISFLTRQWKLIGEHQATGRLSIAELQSVHSGQSVKFGVSSLPGQLEGDFLKGRTTPWTEAHHEALMLLVKEFCTGAGPAVLAFDGGLDWQRDAVRDYYNEAIKGTNFRCIIPRHGRTHHTLVKRDTDLIWVRGLRVVSAPKVLLSVKSTDHSPQSMRLALAR